MIVTEEFTNESLDIFFLVIGRREFLASLKLILSNTLKEFYMERLTDYSITTHLITPADLRFTIYSIF